MLIHRPKNLAPKVCNTKHAKNDFAVHSIAIKNLTVKQDFIDLSTSKVDFNINLEKPGNALGYNH
jgi:hypothetical protein